MSPKIATVVMIVITVLLAVVLYMMIVGDF